MSTGKVTPLPEPRFAPLPPTNQHQGEHEPAPAPAGGGDSAISERTTDLYPYPVTTLVPATTRTGPCMGPWRTPRGASTTAWTTRGPRRSTLILASRGVS